MGKLFHATDLVISISSSSLNLLEISRMNNVHSNCIAFGERLFLAVPRSTPLTGDCSVSALFRDRGFSGWTDKWWVTNLMRSIRIRLAESFQLDLDVGEQIASRGSWKKLLLNGADQGGSAENDHIWFELPRAEGGKSHRSEGMINSCFEKCLNNMLNGEKERRG
jgi:hypothetical protein